MNTSTKVEHKIGRTESLKSLIERSLAYGRRMQSPQTGYIHYYYHAQAEEIHHAIPIYENFCFALALFRSRLMENVQEAKKILEGLLAFQHLDESDFQGNFPVYLHDYPLCRDRLLSIHLLSPLYWILKSFGHVLGQELKAKLEQVVRDLIQHARRTQAWKPTPYGTTIRLAAGMKAFGSMLNDNLLFEQGRKLLQQQLVDRAVENWSSREVITDVLIALQMVYPSLVQSPWGAFWEYVSRTWHRQACCYVGPSIAECQAGYEPQPDLYDVWLGYLSGSYPSRIDKEDLYYLHIPLMQMSEDLLFDNCTPFYLKEHYQKQEWMLVYKKEYAYTLLEQTQPLTPALAKTYTPFHLAWGHPQKTHTLICQGEDVQSVTYKQSPHLIELFFDLNEDYQDERGDQPVIKLYVDFHDQAEWKVEGQSATTVMIGQPIRLNVEDFKVDIHFELLEGEGQFLGHLMRGNRPSQIPLKGESRFNSYDWYLFLRTVRRQGACRLKLSLRILDSGE